MLAVSTFDKETGPIARRWTELLRRIRWQWKTLTRAERVILVECRWRLGDEIMALPVYDALRGRFPNDRIEVLCNYPDLLINYAGVTVCGDTVSKPDLHILLRGAPTHVNRLRHYAERAGIDTPATRPMLRYQDWSSPLLEALPKGNTPIIALASGASWRTKRWSKDSWRALALGLKKQGYRLVELGQRDETIGVGEDLIGRTSVRDAASVLRNVDMLICSDSGLMHLSLAAGTPVLALFGPTDPSILIDDDPRLHVITNDRPCQGCWNLSRTMTEPGLCPKKIEECLETIAPETVLARVQSLLPKKDAA